MPIRITLVFAPRARAVQEVELTVDDGTTAAQALERSGLVRQFVDPPGMPCPIGVWGSKVGHDHVLHDGDRVEVYRSLIVDPKLARRARFATQGARSAGLFARRRPGAKAGY